jgi:hypothetical protein
MPAKTVARKDSPSTLASFLALTIVVALTFLVVAGTVRLALLILGIDA